MEELIEIGLNKNESKIYGALIRFGKLSASELSAKSTVPYGRIYDVLNSLTHKGLVEVVPEKTKKFLASNPDALIKAIEEKEKNLLTLKDKVKEMKQFYDNKEKNPVTMVFGKAAFHKLIKDLQMPKKYSYAVKWTSFVQPDNEKKRKELAKKGVEFKTLSRYDNETRDNVKQWMKFDKNIREMNNDGVAFSVSDDEEIMISLIKSNVTLLIRDKPFAKIMKKMFLATYDKAEKIG